MAERKLRSGLVLISLVLFALITTSSISYSLGVRPLLINLEMKRGESREFDLQLTPSDTQETVALNLYHPRQQLTGGSAYEEGDPERHPVVDWLEVPDSVIIPPGEKKTVTVKVSVPFDSRGTYTAIIMVEPMREEEEGINVKVRYAVRVNIHVEAPGLRKQAEITQFELKPDSENRPLVQARIKNSSSLSFKAAGEVTVRDKNRRLIERVKIRSELADKGGRDKTTIFPGSEVIFKGNVNEPLPAGKYSLQLFLRYAEGRQVIKRKTIEVGDEFVDPDDLQYIEVTPERISEELRRGGAHTEATEIRNRVGDPISIKVGAKKVGSDYERSLLENLKVEMRGGTEFQLEGRRSKRPVLIVRAPREIEAGGYYDKLHIGVFDPETEEQLYSQQVDMEFLVGDDYEYDGEVKSITSSRVEGEVLLSATVANTGDAHFSPRARVYLRRDGEIQHTIYLELAEEGDRILPEMSGTLTTYAQDIEPGEYTADVTLQYEGEDIGRDEFPLKIEPTPEEDEEQQEA